jgi:hypothetical protein
MKKLIVSLLLVLSLNLGAAEIPEHLQDVSVTIRSSQAEGSGVVFTRKEKDEVVNFVWTAAHVIDDLRTTREVISPDGSKRTIVEFQDAKVVKEIRENGRTVGRLEMNAEVIKYSNADTGEDLALLKLRKKNYLNTTVTFYLKNEIPKLGTELYHVGSLLGEQGANSMTFGIYSQHGRMLGKTVFDQTTVTAFPGSSGGGVFLRDGQYIGMLVRGAGETFNLIVPVRRMQSWAKKVNIEWALDPNIPLPSQEDLDKIPVEDVGKNFSLSRAVKETPVENEIKFLIRPLTTEVKMELKK